MPLQMSSLPHFIFFLLLPLVSTRKPDCPTRCGKVSIPYPFGVGSDCSLDRSSTVTCIASKPYLNITNNSIEVVEIRIGNPTRIRIRYPHLLVGVCNNISSGTETWLEMKDIDLSESQYSLSGENWLTAIGCDDFVALSLYKGDESFYDTCIGFCSERSTNMGYCPNNGNRSSVGEGCCRTGIPKGTSYLSANLVDLSKSWVRRRRFPCSYAFVNEKGTLLDEPGYSYNYSILLQNSTTFLKNRQPVVRLDWRIGGQSCLEAQRNSSYACQSNAECVDYGGKTGGYICSCSQGYEGNPYLYPGCKDIDECADNTTYECGKNSYCANTEGSYSCLCTNGFVGDARKEGIDCFPLPTSKSNKMTILIGTGSGLGCLLLLLILFRAYKLFQKRKERILKERFFKRNGGLLLQQQTKESTLRKCNLFTARELEVATDNFNESRILGQGGQGTVYKGMLSNGKIVAVKKSKLVEEKHLEQFINEVVILSQINHRNIVKLLGFCLETEVPLLVYEFMQNGTLFDLIHDPNNEYPVSWNTRLKFAADISGALAYLHSASSVPIYHRDIKSSNILLDEKYAVKISDFGTSMSVAVDQTHLTTMVKGTFGYLDPEYFRSSQFTEKSDVYSFGVVLVELLTGKRPISNDNTDEERGLAMRFLTSMEENCLDTILDPLVIEESKKEEIILVSRLAQRCLNLKGKMRPTMKEVATKLESIRISGMPSSSVKDEVEETSTAFLGKPSTFSDNEYKWSASYNSVSASPLVTHPLMLD